MNSPQEPTTITRMRRDFAAFIGEHHDNSSGIASKRKKLKCALDFDQTLTEFDINTENVAFQSEQGKVCVCVCVYVYICIYIMCNWS